MALSRDERVSGRERGLIAAALSLIAGIAGAVLMALLASVLVEWAGIALGWWHSDHAFQMLRTERAYIEAIDSYPLAPLQPVALSDRAVAGIGDAALGVGLSAGANVYLTAMINSIKLVALRSSLSVFALPGYLLIAVAAFFEGLVARDIRKYTGGHESSYVFHKAKRWIMPTVVLSITIYLMLPFSVAPALVFAPTMLSTGLMVYIATSRFKKFI